MNPAELIQTSIRSSGPVGFDEFMAAALYAQGTGYYEKERSPGKSGDFYTSVSVSGLFGELLAAQISLFAAEYDRLDIVECGAHRGDLMVDVAEALKELDPGLFARSTFTVVEPSKTREGWQRRRFQQAGLDVEWRDGWQDVPVRSLTGVVYSNELLDAMPVKVWRWSATSCAWVELLVGLEADRFVWVAGQTRLPGGEKEQNLPDGFLRETSPAAEEWWRQAAGRLGRGRLLTFDYGLPEEEFLDPARAGGTLRTYKAHRPGGCPLESPGEQDITASVNFTRIQAVGEAAGLETKLWQAQGRFLTRLLASLHATGKIDGAWAASRARAFQTLTSPEFLGGKFHVLIQERAG